jgi:hypothetical protein
VAKVYPGAQYVDVVIESSAGCKPDGDRYTHGAIKIADIARPPTPESQAAAAEKAPEVLLQKAAAAPAAS